MDTLKKVCNVLFAMTHPVRMLRRLDDSHREIEYQHRRAQLMESEIMAFEIEVEEYKKVVAEFTDDVLKELRRIAAAAEIIKEVGGGQAMTPPVDDDLVPYIGRSITRTPVGRPVQAVDFAIAVRLPIQQVMDFPRSMLGNVILDGICKRVGVEMTREFLGRVNE